MHTETSVGVSCAEGGCCEQLLEGSQHGAVVTALRGGVLVLEGSQHGAVVTALSGGVLVLVN